MAFTDFLHGLLSAIFTYLSGFLDGILSGALNSLFGIETPPATS
jgi:hypothetical protein